MTQKKINIALYQPDIPQNTAAIIRVAACLNTCLHIIKPTGFVFKEKKIDRIYMDYIKHCEIKFFDSIEEYLLNKSNRRIILFTTKATLSYAKFKFKSNDILLFGNETYGVSKHLYNTLENQVKIPMNIKTRSFNLVSSVSIGASEALRQLNV